MHLTWRLNGVGAASDTANVTRLRAQWAQRAEIGSHYRLPRSRRALPAKRDGDCGSVIDGKARNVFQGFNERRRRTEREPDTSRAALVRVRCAICDVDLI